MKFGISTIFVSRKVRINCPTFFQLFGYICSLRKTLPLMEANIWSVKKIIIVSEFWDRMCHNFRTVIIFEQHTTMSGNNPHHGMRNKYRSELHDGSRFLVNNVESWSHFTNSGGNCSNR